MPRREINAWLAAWLFVLSSACGDNADSPSENASDGASGNGGASGASGGVGSATASGGASANGGSSGASGSGGSSGASGIGGSAGTGGSAGAPGGFQKVGFGAASKGGDGGTVCTVAWPGLDAALRSCVLSTGPRIVQFDVGKTYDIQLSEPLYIKAANSYLTLDGRGASVTITQPAANVTGVSVRGGAQHVDIYNIRFAGKWQPGMPTQNDSGVLELDGDDSAGIGLQYVFLWRVTVTGGADSATDFYCKVRDVTLMESLIYSNFHPSSMGCNTSNPAKGKQRLTLFRNLYAKNGERQPKMTYVTEDVDLVNHVVYDWKDYGSAIGSGASGYGLLIDDDGLTDRVNVIGSAFVPGSWRPDWGCIFGDLPKGDGEEPLLAKQLHFAGNFFSSQHNAAECKSTATGQQPVQRPYALPGVLPVTQLEDMLPSVGAQPRTAADQGIVDEVAGKLAAF